MGENSPGFHQKLHRAQGKFENAFVPHEDFGAKMCNHGEISREVTDDVGENNSRIHGKITVEIYFKRKLVNTSNAKMTKRKDD